MSVFRLTREDIIFLHSASIEKFGGVQGIRDEGLLDSALNAPFQTFDGSELIPDAVDKAVKLCTGLILNHAFIDGNKRIGTIALLIFLDGNGYEPDCTSQELTEIILALSSGQIDEQDFAGWLKAHIKNKR